jgi:hypothetical protein
MTLIDLNYSGEVVVAGYTSGIVDIWDTIRGIVLRNVNDTHPSPITSERFLTDLKVVTVDVPVGGLVNKLTFARSILWSNYRIPWIRNVSGWHGRSDISMYVLPKYSLVNWSIHNFDLKCWHLFRTRLLLLLCPRNAVRLFSLFV